MVSLPMLSQHQVRIEQSAGRPILAAGLSGLVTLIAVAPCVTNPALLAVPAMGFVALMRYGWRHERDG
ncbi:MAG: hypothetical protein AzoDbin1_04214 [Azoarcus sp.]|nr:hypothetical protein [Azoarcus sp.]